MDGCPPPCRPYSSGRSHAAGAGGMSVRVAAATADAHRLAKNYADRARVRLAESRSNDECTAASDLLAAIWGTTNEASPASSDLLRSIAHAGGCIVGATDHSGSLVGVAVAFAGEPCADRL